MTSRTCCFLLSTVLAVILCCSMAAAESPAPVSETNQGCLGCHGSRDLSVALRSGEKMSLYVDVQSFQRSAHAALDCPSCHAGFSAEKHPSKVPASREAYGLAASALCRNCHGTFRNPIHARMVSAGRGRASACTVCHNPHTVQRVSGQTARDLRFCLACHSSEITISFQDGESLKAKIDPAVLEGSVHSKLYCSNCHFGFSAEEHPVRTFKSRRDYVIAASESCRRCHFDKYTKTLESIHYTALSQGNLDVPVCADCHGAHGIARASREKKTSAQRCKGCHGAVFDIYASSVHGNALFQENNQDVPVCTDCHLAHNIEQPHSFDFREKIPQMCGNCHANKALMAKYGLSTAVLNSYLQDFHGVTLKLYRRQKEVGDATAIRPIAVCIDCHGIHDITATTGPDSSIVKANLVKRCRKCHADATANFPDSWISHYKPSLRKAPLVYAINLTYKIFIPFMMVGLILQILLHIWRYSVNR